MDNAPCGVAVLLIACETQVLFALDKIGKRLYSRQARQAGTTITWSEVHVFRPPTDRQAAKLYDDLWPHIGIAATACGVDAGLLEIQLTSYIEDRIGHQRRHARGDLLRHLQPIVKMML